MISCYVLYFFKYLIFNCVSHFAMSFNVAFRFKFLFMFVCIEKFVVSSIGRV